MIINLGSAIAAFATAMTFLLPTGTMASGASIIPPCAGCTAHVFCNTNASNPLGPPSFSPAQSPQPIIITVDTQSSGTCGCDPTCVQATPCDLKVRFEFPGNTNTWDNWWGIGSYATPNGSTGTFGVQGAGPNFPARSHPVNGTPDYVIHCTACAETGQVIIESWKMQNGFTQDVSFVPTGGTTTASAFVLTAYCAGCFGSCP